jgi:hypothetical protein
MKKILLVLLSNLLIQPSKSKKLSRMKNNSGFGIFHALFLGILLLSNNASAFLGVGDTAIVSDPELEATNSANTAAAASTAESSWATAAKTAATYYQQVEAYAKQTLQYQQQLIDTEMMVQDLEENPLQTLVPNVNQLLANQEKINKLAKAIDTAAPNVGENMARNIKYPQSIGLGQGSKYQLWSESRQQSVQDTLDSVAEFRKSYVDDNNDITTALKDAGTTKDKTATMKVAAFAAAQQAKNAANMLVLMNEARSNAALREAEILDNEASAASAHKALIGTREFKAGDMPPDDNSNVFHGLHY